jgi:hypothetical protein
VGVWNPLEPHAVLMGLWASVEHLERGGPEEGVVTSDLTHTVGERKELPDSKDGPAPLALDLGGEAENSASAASGAAILLLQAWTVALQRLKCHIGRKGKPPSRVA